MEVDPNSAARGVRSRLAGALAALALTLSCILVVVTSGLSVYVTSFAFTVGFTSFGVAVALIMSARHEEEIHEVAARLDAADFLEALPDESVIDGEESEGTDGSVGAQ